MQSYLSGLGAAFLAVLLVGCSDSPVVAIPQGQAPGPSLNATITLTPDSAAGWVPDGITIRVQISGPDADSLRKKSVWWTSADPNLVALAELTDTSVLAIPQHDGVAQVIATVGDVADTAKIVCWEEGAPLAVTEYSTNTLTTTQSVAVAPDGTIYLPRYSDALLAFNADLELVSEIPMVPTWMNAAITDDGNLVVGRAFAVGALSTAGAPLWADTTLTSFESAPAIDSRGDVWIAGILGWGTSPQPGRFAHYDATGARLALHEFGAKVPPVIVQDSVIVIGSLNSNVYGISRSDSVLWTDTLGRPLKYWSPSVGADGRTVYLPISSATVAVDGLTGEILWTHYAAFPSAPIVDADGTIYMQYGSQYYGLVAFNPDGSVRWQADSLGSGHGLYVASSPALAAGGVLYVPCQFDVCAVNTADGSVRWRHALPNEVAAGTMAGQIMILPDSSILFATLRPMTDGGPAYLIKLRGRFPLADAPWPVDGGDLRRTRRGHMP